MTAIGDRARGALWGLALGDAYGMPTQRLSRAAIAATYGPVDRLLAGAADQPLAPGLPAGSVTDDTEQALIVGRLLVDGGGSVTPRALADALIGWEASLRARGSLDLLGPSSAAAIRAIAGGENPASAGRDGTTNGAAMRIAPVGIAVAPDPAAALLDAVVAVSSVTHATGLALSGAAAVAAAVSGGVAGLAPRDSLARALALAESAAGRGRWVAGASVARRTRWALTQTSGLGDAAFADFLVDVVGTSLQTQESVPAALLIADRWPQDPATALRCAAALGGDTDTIAAIAGAVLGAHLGVAALPAAELATVRATNPGLDLDPLADDLLALRRRARP